MSKHRSVPILSAIGVFLVAAAAPQVGSAMILTNHFDTDPLWTGFNNTAPSNNYGYSATTSVAGGSPGEVGGTFARRAAENYYADVGLGGFNNEFFTLGYSLQGSGRLDLTNTAAMNNSVYVGHLSANSADKSFIGLYINESNVNIPTMFRVQPLVRLSDSTDVTLLATNAPIGGDYWFSYSYNPTGGANSQGQLSVTLTNATFSYFASVDLTAANRVTGAKFDSFGMYQAPINNTAEHGDVFIDDVIYTGVPEPTTVALMGLGGMMILWRRRGH